MRYLVGEAMTGGYGDADILHDCTIGVDEGEIAVVVGPNGAGKSTAMKAVFGMLGLRSGRVLMDGEDITALKPQDRVRKGMGFVPQTNNVGVVPSIKGEGKSASRRAVWWPASAGGCWPGSDDTAKSSDAGRANSRCVPDCDG